MILQQFQKFYNANIVISVLPLYLFMHYLCPRIFNYCYCQVNVEVILKFLFLPFLCAIVNVINKEHVFPL